MDSNTLALLYNIFQKVQQQQDWKTALDTLFVSLRSSFVFDNVAIYLKEKKQIEAVYARAVGRGKTAEADAAWGEALANQIILSGERMMDTPKTTSSGNTNRLSLPYLLGFPLYIASEVNGALLFVRFGGPEYTAEHIQLAGLQSFWAAALIEQRDLLQARAELDSVQRQMRLQDDFVSTITHELRTPLGFIKGYSTSLLRDDTQWDEATQREFLTVIDEEADRLARLIDDMLEAARLHSKTLQFKFSPVRIDSLIRDVFLRIAAHHPGLKARFNFENIPPIQGDGKRLSQVFENLFSNAIKYAPDSELFISACASPQKIRVEFSDRGPGIPAEYLPFLFERFYRVPNDNAVKGTGLGLYICRQIIAAHHGTIWAESTPGSGATFIIELPLGETLV